MIGEITGSTVAGFLIRRIGLVKWLAISHSPLAFMIFYIIWRIPMISPLTICKLRESQTEQSGRQSDSDHDVTRPTLNSWRDAFRFLRATYASVFRTFRRARPGHKRLLILLNGVQFFVTGMTMGESHCKH